MDDKHVINCNDVPEIDMTRQDGGLEHKAGVYTYQIRRSCRTDGDYTYNHAPMLTAFNNRLVLSYISGKRDEHGAPDEIVYTTSKDGCVWDKEKVLFPYMLADTDGYTGPDKELLPKKAPAIVHFRMCFYKASNGKLIATTFYGFSPDSHRAPNNGYGAARLVREVYKDYTLSDMYIIKYNEAGGFNGDNTIFYSPEGSNEQLDIPYYVMNFKKEFKANVMDYFVDEYLHGRTPNPCIACNRYVKWESLLQRSLQIGADYIATGHYARIEQLANGRYAIRNSVTAKKDQTYALYNLTQEQLSRTLMPVGDYTKDEIRKIASEIGIQVANKPDSMEICFVPDNDYAGFIQRETDYIPKEGNFVDIHGNVIGKHKGIIHYTVGQRKGLGLAMGHPVFVTEIRPDTNEVVIGENADVFASKLYANKLNFMAAEAFTGDVRAKAKIRYSHAGADCTVRMINEDTLECVFDEPQRAVTPGQALVLYDGEYVLGGGTIIGKAVE